MAIVKSWVNLSKDVLASSILEEWLVLEKFLTRLQRKDWMRLIVYHAESNISIHTGILLGQCLLIGMEQ